MIDKVKQLLLDITNILFSTHDNYMKNQVLADCRFRYLGLDRKEQKKLDNAIKPLIHQLLIDEEYELLALLNKNNLIQLINEVIYN